MNRSIPTPDDAYQLFSEWLTAIGAKEPKPLSKTAFLGSGLTYDAYSALCDLGPPYESEPTRIVIRIPNPDAESNQPDRAWIEHNILLTLSAYTPLPYHVPLPLGILDSDFGPVVFQSFLTGREIDLRWTRSHVHSPWEVVAEVAAATHRIPLTPFHPFLTGHQTRLEHALCEIKVFDRLPIPYMREAKQWCLDHLPEPSPCSLLHGDLLGQNVLVDMKGEVSVIDWNESFLGDPSFELAIVTRGEKRPFNRGGAVDAFLSHYNRYSGDSLTRQHLYLYELILSASWYLHDALEDPTTEEAEESLRFFRHILRRATSS